MINLPFCHAGVTLALAAVVAWGASIAVIETFKTVSFLGTCKATAKVKKHVLRTEGVVSGTWDREAAGPAMRSERRWSVG